MKALAVLGARRVNDLPAVATQHTEQGFPELRVDGWTAIAWPLLTMQIIIDRSTLRW